MNKNECLEDRVEGAESAGGLTVGPYTYGEYLERVRRFHGHIAPGMALGGFMVDLALKHLPEGELFDAVCETRACLPDAVQLLTPCTIGNGWLKVINMGRYAVTLYEKLGGKGVRVHVEAEKVDAWPELKAWYFKLKPKKEQDFGRLMAEIHQVGAGICGKTSVQLDPDFIKVRRRKGFRICALCGEAYPITDGAVCRGCQGDAPYVCEGITSTGDADARSGFLKVVPVEEAVGMHALSDMTRIVPGREKGPAFRRGQELTAGDVCRLQQMGRAGVYTVEDSVPGRDWVHEDEAALAFAAAMAGEGVTYSERPSEGRIDFEALNDGLLVVDSERLEAFNLIPGVMCATRKTFSVLSGGRRFAGTRAIPLYLPQRVFARAMQVLEEGPLFCLRPLRRARAGVLVTGTELFRGLIDDKFVPIVRHKLEALGSLVAEALIVPDEKRAIRKGVQRLLDAGADLIVTTAGLSVDPDDVTRQGLVDAGVEDMLYGTPILPGAMTLLARIGSVPVLGVPACALYFKTTSLDLLLPRLLAGVPVTRRDLARMADGGFCLNCKVCTYPKCPFGK
jgi:formylmethanofuran dehydrogenase subunit E